MNNTHKLLCAGLAVLCAGCMLMWNLGRGTAEGDLPPEVREITRANISTKQDGYSLSATHADGSQNQLEFAESESELQRESGDSSRKRSRRERRKPRSRQNSTETELRPGDSAGTDEAKQQPQIDIDR